MKKLLFLVSLLAVVVASTMHAQSVSEKNTLFPLSNKQADYVCDAARSHLKDLALLLLCGAELKNHTIELMNNSSGQLAAVNRGSSLTIYYPFFPPFLAVRMHEFNFEVKEDEKSTSAESKNVIEVTTSTYTYSPDQRDLVNELRSWLVPKHTSIVESGETVKFSPQEFGEFLKHCARRKPKTNI